MQASRWVGAVRVDISHLGATSLPGTHAYGVAVTPSSGGRWTYEGAWTHEPTEPGVDRVAAELASAVALGALQMPETFGGEQTWLDIAELIDAGLATAQGPWPVRRSELGAAALVEVLEDDARTLADQLPMRIEVADRTVTFEAVPGTPEGAPYARAALESLRLVGVVVIEQDLRGALSHPDQAWLREALLTAFTTVSFTGKLRIDGDQFEYSDGDCRIAGWEHKTVQVEARIVAAEAGDAELLVGVLEAASRRPDVADLDVDATRGGFHVLASVQNPEGFLQDLRNAVQRSGFQGVADLSAVGRWRFEPQGAVRLDQGVPI